MSNEDAVAWMILVMVVFFVVEMAAKIFGW